MQFTFPLHYPWVLVAGAAIGLQCHLTGFIVPQGIRSKIFNKEFMNQFQEQHQKETGETQPPQNGYPDMGNGRYSEKLSYKDWYEFNNSQRVHQNYTEQVGFIIPGLLIAGLSFAPLAAGLGATYFLGRGLYAYSYSTGGPDKRIAGAATSHLSATIIVGAALVSAIKLALRK